MCDFEKIGKPPATSKPSNEDVKAIAEVPLVLDHPCHNQCVERHVKLVSEACSSVCSFSRRDGLIRQKIKSRKLMRRCDNKGQYSTFLC